MISIYVCEMVWMCLAGNVYLWNAEWSSVVLLTLSTRPHMLYCSWTLARPIVCLPLLCLPFTGRFLTPGYMKSSTGENKPMLNRQLTSIGAEFLHTAFEQNVHVVLGIALHVHCTETYDSRKCWLHMKFWMWRKKDKRKGNMRLTNYLSRTGLRSLPPSDNVVSVM
jgi:hypothetical protein